LPECRQSEATAVRYLKVLPVDVLPIVALQPGADPLVEAEARLGHVLLDDEKVLADLSRRDREANVCDVLEQMTLHHRHDLLVWIHLAVVVDYGGTCASWPAFLVDDRIGVDRKIGEAFDELATNEQHEHFGAPGLRAQGQCIPLVDELDVVLAVE